MSTWWWSIPEEGSELDEFEQRRQYDKERRSDVIERWHERRCREDEGWDGEEDDVVVVQEVVFDSGGFTTTHLFPMEGGDEYPARTSDWTRGAAEEEEEE